MKKTWQVILITTAAFIFYFILDELYFHKLRNEIYSVINQWGISHILTYLLSGIPLYVAVILMHQGRFAESLGINKPIFKGLLAAFIFTAPMFLGFVFLFTFNDKITLDDILVGSLAAGFFEELFFRGFLFGQIFRYTKLGFFPSVLAGALLFASIHMYQSQDFATLGGIFIITFMGAILFAWLYSEWKYNLWVPVFLHMLMNLAWSLFDVSENALGDVYANIFRFSTVFLAIFFTILYKRKKGLKLEINKNTVWMKKNL